MKTRYTAPPTGKTVAASSVTKVILILYQVMPRWQTVFHVYSLVWTPQSLTWYIDDIQYHSMSLDESEDLSAFQKPFFLIFNVAVGGNWPGSPNANTQFPQRMLIDYVRVFSEDGTTD